MKYRSFIFVRIITLCVCGYMLLLISVCFSGDRTDRIIINHIAYNRLGGDSVEVAYLDEPSNYTIDSVDIPSTVKHNDTVFRVVSIGCDAFDSEHHITSVTLPGSVTIIGDRAFWHCSNLKSVRIPESVTSIGNFAFAYCGRLEEVAIPESVVYVGDGAFLKCDSIIEPIYNSHLFAYLPASYGGEYEIHEGISYISGLAFADCEWIERVTLPESLDSAGFRPFANCKWIEKPFYTDKVFLQIPDSFSGYYSMPKGIRYIAGGAFYQCKGLTGVGIPESVEGVGERVFSGSGLSEPVIIKNIFVYLPRDYEVVLDDFLCEYVVPDGVTEIARGAFDSCTRLESVILPVGLQRIGEGAFENCKRLDDVYIPEGITRLEKYVFKDCRVLNDIVIPASVRHIESYAFQSCDIFRIITIPKDVVSIEPNAFAYCSRMDTVKIEGRETFICNDAFERGVKFEKPWQSKWFWRDWTAEGVLSNLSKVCFILAGVAFLSLFFVGRFLGYFLNVLYYITLTLITDPSKDGKKGRPKLRLSGYLFQNELYLFIIEPLFWLLSVLERCFRALISGIGRYMDFKGKATRSEFWWLVLSVFMTEGIVFCSSPPIAVWLKPDFDLSDPLYISVLVVITIVLLVPLCSCSVRRINDVKEGVVSEISEGGRRVIVATRAKVLGDETDEYSQHGPSCAIKSQQIILNEFGVMVSEKECCDYAASRGWYYSKTDSKAHPSWENIGNLLEHYGIPIRRYKNATINDMMMELTQGHMIIAGVDSSELYMNKWFRCIDEVLSPNHAMIVNGIDVSNPNRKVAYITDSAMGIHNYDCPLDHFMDAWQDSNGFMLATQNPIPGWSFSQDIKPYEFNLDEYPYNLVRPKEEAGNN